MDGSMKESAVDLALRRVW